MTQSTEPNSPAPISISIICRIWQILLGATKVTSVVLSLGPDAIMDVYVYMCMHDKQPLMVRERRFRLRADKLDPRACRNASKCLCVSNNPGKSHPDFSKECFQRFTKGAWSGTYQLSWLNCENQFTYTRLASQNLSKTRLGNHYVGWN